MKQWIPTPGDSQSIISGAVLGVSLEVDEEVASVYTILPDGKRSVTGHDILQNKRIFSISTGRTKKMPPKKEEAFVAFLDVVAA